MLIQKIREICSHRLKEGIMYVFLTHPEKEFTLYEVGVHVLIYFDLENENIPPSELKTYSRRLHKALTAKEKTGFIEKRQAKNSIVKNYILYKLGKHEKH